MIATSLLLIAIGVGIWIAYDRFSTPSKPADWLPSELSNAKEFSREKQFEAKIQEHTIVAKPDRVYRLPDGTLVPIEFKTRAQHVVYEPDQIQLTAGAAALGDRAAGFGFVITQDADGGRKSHRVELNTGEAFIQLLHRFADITTGRQGTQKTTRLAKCKSCPHKTECGR